MKQSQEQPSSSSSSSAGAKKQSMAPPPVPAKNKSLGANSKSGSVTKLQEDRFRDSTVSHVYNNAGPAYTPAVSMAGPDVSRVTLVSETTGREKQIKRGNLHLSDLREDGAEAYVKDLKNPSRVLIKGTIQGDRIVLDRIYGAGELPAREFVKQVADKLELSVTEINKQYKKFMYIKTAADGERSYEDRCSTFNKEDTNALKQLTDELAKHYNETEADLKRFSDLQNRKLLAYANRLASSSASTDVPGLIAFHRKSYRVLRMDEKIDEGIIIPSGQTVEAAESDKKGSKKRAKSGREKMGPVAFFAAMSGHIRSASRQKSADQRKFISANGNLESALGWGGFGLQHIAVIDHVKCAQMGITAWHMGSVHEKLMTIAGQATNQARASDEVVFAENVPKEAMRLLTVEWTKSKSILPHNDKDFPKELKLNEIKLLRVLNHTSTVPYEVEINGKRYVMKFGGRTSSRRSSHVETEYFANLCYSLAGIPVPPAALYIINVRASDESRMTRIPGVCVLLVKYITRTRELQETDFEELRKGMAMDVALANFDVIGPDLQDNSNIIVGRLGEKDRERVYRIDQGGCFEHVPIGGAKIYEPTEDKVQLDINSFMFVKDSTETSHILRVKAFVGDGEAAKDASRRNLVSSAVEIMAKFEDSLKEWLDKRKDLMPSWQDKSRTLITRLQRLAGIGIAPKRAPLADLFQEPPEDADDDDERDTAMDVVVNEDESDASADQTTNNNTTAASTTSPRAASNNVASGSSTTPRFHTITIVSKRARKEDTKDQRVVDVTSKSPDGFKVLSPFAPHLDKYDVPGLPGKKSSSVEGIWQGLKVFEKKDGSGQESYDCNKFNNTTEQKLKRAANRSNRGRILGHFAGEGKALLTPVGRARREVYLPAYKEQLERNQNKIEQLRTFAREKNLMLLDYNTSEDLDSTKPLSHAQLIKYYILHNTLDGFGEEVKDEGDGDDHSGSPSPKKPRRSIVDSKGATSAKKNQVQKDTTVVGAVVDMVQAMQIDDTDVIDLVSDDEQPIPVPTATKKKRASTSSKNSKASTKTTSSSSPSSSSVVARLSSSSLAASAPFSSFSSVAVALAATSAGSVEKKKAPKNPSSSSSRTTAGFKGAEPH